MPRLLSSLALFLIATVAQAQNQPTVPTQEAAGTTGDTALIVWIAIAVVIVGVGAYLYLRRAGRDRM